MEVPLTQGRVALIDDADYPLVSQYKWFAHLNHGKRWYAETNVIGPARNVTLGMHRLILQAPFGTLVDHANGDGLDNRRCNIRIATHAQNTINSNAPIGSTGYRGVWFDKRSKSYRAAIVVRRRRLHLGTFSAALDAALAYDAAARKYHGEFARTNFGAANASAMG